MDSRFYPGLGVSLAFVPEDRIGMGLVGAMDMTDNMMLRSYHDGQGRPSGPQRPQEAGNRDQDQLEIMTPTFPRRCARCPAEMCRRFWWDVRSPRTRRYLW